MNNLRVGDVVTLKSGSPSMTIASIRDGRAECTYFTRKGEYSCEAPVECFTRLEPREVLAGES